MAASFPASVKTFSSVVNGVTKLVAALFNSPYDEITAIETALAQLIHTDGSIKAACINTTALKTSTGEVSGNNANLTLPGGEYGFYPQIKTSSTGNVAGVGGIIGAFNFTNTSYVTNISFANGITSYAQQRYVTASGKDWWIFLLLDKDTKEIIASYSAPDHPAYGNGGDFDELPHPFVDYDESKHEIVLVDNETISELKSKATLKKSILTLINESYKPEMSKEEIYQPLHSGKFLGKEAVLLKTIPEYIKVRKLIVKQ